MKLCLMCRSDYATLEWRCPYCGFEPPLIGSVRAFAPQLASADSGFRQELFAELAALEASNFWFRARNRLIVWSIKHYFPGARSMLEVGCGTGYVLSGVRAALPSMRLAGSEVSVAGLPFAAERAKDVDLYQMDARQLPFKGEFDVVGAFDVLEHIEEDGKVLAQMHQAVAPGGGIVITVPQHPFLWSVQDEYARHVRRYRARELAAKAQSAGFRIERLTSFVSLLLPAMLLARRRRQDPKTFDPTAELKVRGFLNWSMERLMDLERALIKAGLDLPIGGSLLLVAKKPG